MQKKRNMMTPQQKLDRKAIVNFFALYPQNVWPIISQDKLYLQHAYSAGYLSSNKQNYTFVKQTNVFYTPNGFCNRYVDDETNKNHGKKVTRKAYTHLSSLECLYTDIDLKDCKVTGVSVENFMEYCSEILAEHHFPEPTLIVCSGHGFHLVWKIKSLKIRQGCTDVVDMESLSVWYGMQIFIQKMFSSFGADRKIALDPTRFLRYPGTINQKPEREPVHCYHVSFNETVYNLYQLAEQLQVPRLRITQTMADKFSYRAGVNSAYDEDSIFINRPFNDEDVKFISTGEYENYYRLEELSRYIDGYVPEEKSDLYSQWLVDIGFSENSVQKRLAYAKYLEYQKRNGESIDVDSLPECLPEDMGAVNTNMLAELKKIETFLGAKSAQPAEQNTMPVQEKVNTGLRTMRKHTNRVSVKTTFDFSEITDSMYTGNNILYFTKGRNRTKTAVLRLFQKRCADIERLLHIRDEQNIIGHREVSFFILGYYYASILDSAEQAYQKAAEINKSLNNGLDAEELKHAIVSGINYYTRNVGMIWTNRALYEVLSITTEEEKKMYQLISEQECKTRKVSRNIRYNEKRKTSRALAKNSQEIFLRNTIKGLLESGKNIEEVCELCDISRATLFRKMKDIKIVKPVAERVKQTINEVRRRLSINRTNNTVKPAAMTFCRQSSYTESVTKFVVSIMANITEYNIRPKPKLDFG